jgi:hypothetical protein
MIIRSGWRTRVQLTLRTTVGAPDEVPSQVTPSPVFRAQRSSEGAGDGGAAAWGAGGRVAVLARRGRGPLLRSPARGSCAPAAGGGCAGAGAGGAATACTLTVQ